MKLNNRKSLKESELRSLVKTLLEDKTLGPQMVKVNPVVDPSAAITDPSNVDYKPSNKQELQVAISAMLGDVADEKSSIVYDSLKQALKSCEDVKGTKQMEKSNAKIEETIRVAIRSMLSNITLKEYFEKNPETGEMVWKGSGPAPKLAPKTGVQKLDPSARGVVVGAKAPDVKSLRSRLKSMKDLDFTATDTSQPAAGRTRKNVMMSDVGGEGLKQMAKDFGFKNPNGVLQFITRTMDKFKTRFENIDQVNVALLEIMKDYITELSSSAEMASADVQMMYDHPEHVLDLDSFRVYANKKLKQRGL